MSTRSRRTATRFRALAAAAVVVVGSVVVAASIAAAPTTLTTPLTGPATVGEPGSPATSAGACRIGPADQPCGSDPVQVRADAPDLPGCPEGAARAAVVDKAAQRFWLCEHGAPVTEARPMTSGSEEYGLPPIGTHKVFAKNSVATGIHGERLERFVAFYTTPRKNRIAFHKFVNQPEDTVGDLDQRGDSSGCLRVTTDDSWLVWNFLQIGDPVVVITP